MTECIGSLACAGAPPDPTRIRAVDCRRVAGKAGVLVQSHIDVVVTDQGCNVAGRAAVAHRVEPLDPKATDPRPVGGRREQWTCQSSERVAPSVTARVGRAGRHGLPPRPGPHRGGPTRCALGMTSRGNAASLPIRQPSTGSATIPISCVWSRNSSISQRGQTWRRPRASDDSSPRSQPARRAWAATTDRSRLKCHNRSVLIAVLTARWQAEPSHGSRELTFEGSAILLDDLRRGRVPAPALACQVST